jgi:hypothetical protein
VHLAGLIKKVFDDSRCLIYPTTEYSGRDGEHGVEFPVVIKSENALVIGT